MLSKDRFGLLTGCDHPFCLECIRKWRGTLFQSKDAVRGCPICRQPSFFVVPCDRLVTNIERKNKIVESFKHQLSTMPCKHFTINEQCPFGTSCFYLHKRKVEILFFSIFVCFFVK